MRHGYFLSSDSGQGFDVHDDPEGLTLTTFDHQGNAEAIIDGRLVVAARDMLEALRECYELIRDLGYTDVLAYERAEAAIKKATGTEED